jgi:hypothetical protein
MSYLESSLLKVTYEWQQEDFGERAVVLFFKLVIALPLSNFLLRL